MIKNLHVSVAILIFIYSTASAQNERSKLNVIDKTQVAPSVQPIKSVPNIPEQVVPKMEKVPDAGKTKATNVTPVNFSTTKTNAQRQARKEMDVRNTSTQKIAAVDPDAPLYPDLKVTAIKEEVPATNYTIKETGTRDMEKVKKDGPEEVSVSANTDPNNFTISPNKRIYLQGVAAELEKEILSHPNDTSSDMQAKRKELEELKKLLTH